MRRTAAEVITALNDETIMMGEINTHPERIKGGPGIFYGISSG